MKKFIQMIKGFFAKPNVNGELPRKFSQEEIDKISKDYATQLHSLTDEERQEAFYSYRNGLIQGLDLRGNFR
jgi:hypothetical protein